MKADELGVWEKLQEKITWEQLGEFSGKKYWNLDAVMV